MAESFGPLVSAEWLHEHLGEPDLRVIDFRWYLLSKQGRDEYLAGHIPGAVFVELDDVTGQGGGRHPLPTGAQLEGAMRRAGVDRDTRVVVYDDVGGSVAARLWFLLRWFGHGAQAVLDGGPQAWAGRTRHCWTRARASAIAAKPSRSTPRPATSRVPAARRSRATCARTAASSHRRSCARGSTSLG